MVRMDGKSEDLTVLAFSFSILSSSGEVQGAGREALRTEETFPLEITYTEQKSGTPFDTLLGMFDVLNLHKKNN